MSPERLLKHFEQICEAPDAVSRFRRFILDIAVRGKLLPQNTGDEPASELLKRIDAEIMQYTKAGKIKKQSFLPIDDRDVLFEIPKNWRWVRLGNIGEWGSGCTPSRGNNEYFGGGITWLKSGELEDNFDLKGSKETITEKAIKECSFRLNKAGDVLIAMYGATIGKLAILGEAAVTNQAVCGCTPFGAVYNRYLFTFLLSQREYFRSQSEGGAQPNISKIKIVNFGIALPPFAEQHRIVTKVDKLMALCDKLEAAQAKREKRRDRLVAATLYGLNNGDATSAPDAYPTFKESARFYLNHLPRLTTRPEHIHQLRQTILNLAVRGKLVPQDPHDEPVAELLRRIDNEKPELLREGKIKQISVAAPVTSDEIPFEIPKTWKWVRVSEVAHCRLGKMLDKAKNKGTFRCYLRNLNVRWFDFDLSDLFEMRFQEDELEEFSLRKGDVLICEGGEPGRAAVWDGRATDVYFQKAVHRVRFFGSIDPVYFVRCLYQDAMSGRLGPFFTGVGIKHFTGKGLARYSFPLPPLAEQHRITKKVNEIMALCDKLEAGTAITTATRFKLLENSMQ